MIKLKLLKIDLKIFKNTKEKRDRRRLYNKEQVIHSGNLYQIFTYVKNKEVEFADKPHVVSGMLLYAKTDETLPPNQTYQMSGNKISVKTLDLDCDFEKIAEQLDAIVEEFFG